jgi:hypothetical protein
MNVLSLFLSLALLGLSASAQSAASARKLPNQALLSDNPASLFYGSPARAKSEAAGTRPPTTSASWTGTAGDNNWGTAGNWNPSGAPNGSTVNVTIGTTTANVNLNINATVDALTLSKSGDTLNFNNNQTLTADGNITNNGSITLNSAGNYTSLTIGSSAVTLSGTGSLTMGNNSDNFITAAAGTDKFTNAQTISGAGNIGNNSLTLVNSGTIDATQSNVLYIQTSGGTTNTGTIEATTGTLVLYGNTVTNTGGTIKSTGSDLQLVDGVTINGGTLTTSGSGLIHTTGGQASTLENLTNSGNYQLDNSAQTTLVGTITNNGNMNMASVGNGTYFLLSGNVTLSGTGTLTMSNNSNNVIEGVSGAGTEVLTNNINIAGAGDIGNGQTILVNNAAGIINANQSGGTLTIAPTANATNGFTNTGTLEATAGGTLALNSGTYTNAVGSAQGTILANNGTVNLNNGATVVGGTLKSQNGGVIQNTATAFLNGSTSTGAVTVATGTSLSVLNNTNLQVEGSIVNNGTISLNSVGNGTYIEVNGAAGSTATLSGTGTLTLSNNGNNEIYGANASNVFINKQTIQGSGNIGGNQMAFTNQGTVNANQSTQLYIQTSNGTTNTGTLEATAGGTLTLYGNTVTNTGGTIQAIGTSASGGAAAVNLQNGVTVVGGTLTSNQYGAFYDLDNVTLSGLTSTATINVNNNTALNLVGTIVNNGAINLNSAGNATNLVMQGNVALNGTGTINLSNNSNNQIYGAAGTDVLTLASTQTIAGAGNVGANQMTLVNNGIIDGNISNILYLQTSGGTTNAGTLEATAGGQLSLYGNTVTNTGSGSIVAGSGSTVYLQNGVTVVGGSLTGSGTFVESGNSTLSGLTNASTIQVQNNNAMYLTGNILNNGSIQLNSGGNNTDLILNGNVALNGTGNVTLSNNGNNFIYGAVGSDVLTVASTQTIQGAGNIGSNQMTLVNNGTINGNASSGLTIQASGGTTNAGLIEATNGGSLTLLGGTITNTGTGSISAGAGTTVNLTNGVTVTGGSLTGSGTFQESAGSTLSGLTNASTVVVQNNNAMYLTGTITNNGQIQENSGGNNTDIILTGNVTLNGTGALVMSSNGDNFIYGSSGTYTLTNASTIEGAGNLGDGQMSLVNSGTINANVSNNLNIAVSGTVNNTGTFEATGGGSLVVTAPTGGFLNYTSSNNTLTGGTYIANGGNIYLPLGTTGGITTLAAKVTEEGGSQIFNSNNGNANALNGLTSITSAGALTIGGTAFTDAGSFSNAGSLTILSGESFSVGSLTQISGGKLTAGTYVLDANLTLSGATQTITTNSATLTLAGGTIENANATNALAGLSSNTKSLTIAGTGNKVSTTAASFSNTGTLTINKGDSFTAKALTQLSGSNSSKTLSAGSYVLAGNLSLTTTGLTITTNSANLTLEGGTIQSGTANALSALASNTSNLTIAGTATNVSTTASSFSNTGTLTINKGDSFTAPALTQISTTGGITTLTGGTYVLAGNLDLTSTASENITVNSANLTLEGGTIQTGTVNDLKNLNSNTNALTLASNANFTTSTTSSFTNTGTVTVSKGSTLTVGGTAQNYNQTAGTTTVDGTMASNGAGTAFVTGGTIQGAGTITANVSVGNATGTVGTINVGDAGKAGLLSITGTYTQLATGNMTGTINGTTAGSGYSQLKVTGAASLAGTVAFTVSSSFQASLKAGQTFTVLTASSITGTFSNSTIAINSSFHFNVSYTSTGVVLTVASGAAPASAPANPLGQVAVSSPKPFIGMRRTSFLVSSRQRGPVVARPANPILVASGGRSSGVSARNALITSPRVWERGVRPGFVRPVGIANANSSLAWNGLVNRIAPIRSMGIRSTMGAWTSGAGAQHVPVKIMRPSLPRGAR